MDTRDNHGRLFLLAGFGVGLGFVGGGAAWVLVRAIRVLTNATLFHRWSTAEPRLGTLHPGWPLFAAAILGALAVSLLAKWAPAIRGHGIPEAMEAVLVNESRVRPRTAIAKPLSAAIAIGTGAPFGAEGPIIVTGGSIGSFVGQIVRVSASERKILLAAGAAAGMSATFGAPIAAVVLALELLVFEFSARAFVPIAIASSVAGAMHAALFSAAPLFRVPVHDYAGLGALPAFAVLGLACGALATIISRGLFVVEALWRKARLDEFWHPVFGALGFATVGLFVPRVLGVGYDVIGDVLASRLALGTVAAIAVAKLVAWWLALGSGTSGGTLAPVLLVSAAFGTVVGSGINHVLPGPDIALGAFAVVAMAATFGAATQATFTAIVFVFELTGAYDVILPIMLATVLADLVYSATNDDSLMTEKLRRRGLRFARHYAVDPLATTAVVDIMRAPLGDAGATAPPGPVVFASDPALRALDVLLHEHLDQVDVVDDAGDVVGCCSRDDVLEVYRRGFAHERVAEPARPRVRRRHRVAPTGP